MSFSRNHFSKKSRARRDSLTRSGDMNTKPDRFVLNLVSHLFTTTKYLKSKPLTGLIVFINYWDFSKNGIDVARAS